MQSPFQQSGRRDADEAAVISLLANQLSNNQVLHIYHEISSKMENDQGFKLYY